MQAKTPNEDGVYHDGKKTASGQTRVIDSDNEKSESACTNRPEIEALEWRIL
jgi:hypothetical protein